MFCSTATFNVAQCAIGLCLILFAFLAMSSIEVTTILDYHKHDPSISEHGGYYSQTILYGTFVISNLLAPFMISLIGCRWSMVLGSVGYTLFMSQFLYLQNWTLYGFSAIEGLGAGFMWSAVGYYMALNSDDSTIGRNSSLLWLLCNLSNIFGGIYLLCIFGFMNTTEIDANLRTILFGTFCGVAALGNIVFALIRTTEKEVEKRRSKKSSNLKNLIDTFRLIPTKKMLLLMIPYAFTGLETSFYSAVYPTSLSFTKQFSMNSKMVLGMNNLAVGFGQIAGCIGCMAVERFVKTRGRYLIVIAATILHIISFILIGLDIPGEASYEETYGSSVLPPSPVLAVLAGLMLGVVDAAFNTQLYAITSELYTENCSQAMALFKFYHAILSTVSMFYGSVWSLLIQMGILAALAILSAAAFAVCEVHFKRKTSTFAVEKKTVELAEQSAWQDIDLCADE